MALKPEKEKVGNIKKCPNCGAEVESFQTKCTSCGFEFRDVEVAGTIKELFAKIQSESSEYKADVIKETPIPNSKEMLLEFTVLAYAQIDWEADSKSVLTTSKLLNQGPFTKGRIDNDALTQQKINIAWKSKIKEAYSRAKIALIDDRGALAQIETMVKEMEAAGKKAKLKSYSYPLILVGAIILLIILMGIGLAAVGTPEKETKRLYELETQIEQLIDDEKWNAARSKATELMWEHQSHLEEYAKNVEEWKQKREEFFTVIEEGKNKEKDAKAKGKK